MLVREIRKFLISIPEAIIATVVSLLIFICSKSKLNVNPQLVKLSKATDGRSITITCVMLLIFGFLISQLRHAKLHSTTEFHRRIKHKKCPDLPPNLVNISKPVDWKTDESKNFPLELTELNHKFGFSANGLFKPKCGKPSNGNSIAIVIPYRDRPVQLRVFLEYMIPMFLKQQLQFKIYVIDQVPHTTFNRAKLFNVGYDIAKKDAEEIGVQWDCFTFHDVDLFLENEFMLYKCDKNGNPRHLSVAVSSMDYSIEETYKWDIFGGICQVTGKVFEKANGFANHYKKLKIIRSKRDIFVYFEQFHFCFLIFF